MKRALLLIFVLGLTAAAVVPRADAHHTAGWHWRRTSNPVDVRLINGTGGAWQRHVALAAHKWSKKSTVVDITYQVGSGGCGAVNDAVKVCNGWFSGGWAGLTTVSLSGHHIDWATVRLDNSAGSAKRAVACHEIGHALGLAHRPQGQNTSCMTPSVSSTQVRPDGHDLRMLQRIYQHLDGSGAREDGEHRIVRIYTYL